jgi:hypothetical protein
MSEKSWIGDEGIDSGSWDGGIKVRLHNVLFQKNERYGEDVALTFDLENELGETRENQILSIGKGFIAGADGKSVTHQRAKANERAVFGKGSKGQVFLGSVVGSDAAQNDGKPVHFEEKAQAGLTPRDAGLWEDLVVEWENETVTLNGKNLDGEPIKYQQPKGTFVGYGRELLGLDGVGAGAGDVVNITAEGIGVDDATFATLVTMVEESADHTEFWSKAVTLGLGGAAAEAIDDDVKGLWGLKG